MPDEATPGYEGKGQAIHVDPGSYSVTPEPEGPPTDVAMMTGKSKPITSHADSPSQWLDESVTGPLSQYAVYWGRSAAIHVYGTPLTSTPPPPIHSCNCCAEVGTPAAVIIIEDFEDRTHGAGGWGIAHPAGFAWQYVDSVADPTLTDAQVYESGLDGGWPGNPTEHVGSQLASGLSAPGSAYIRSPAGSVGVWQDNEWTLRWKFAWELTAAAGPVWGVVTDGAGSLGVQLGGSSFVLGGVLDDTFATASFSFTHDEPYYLQLHYRKDSVVEAKVWRCVDSEPGSYEVHGVPDHAVDSTSYLFGSSPQGEAGQEAFETAEIASLVARGDCTDGVTHLRFDDFARTGPTWDHASSGPAWTQTGSGTADTYGGAELIPVSNSNIKESTTTPLDSGTDFTCTIKFFVFNGVTNANFVFAGLNFGWRQSSTLPTSPNHDELYLWDGSGSELRMFINASGTDDFWHSSAGASTSNWAFIKVDRFGLHVRAKIWGDAHAEPGWMLEGDLEDFTTLTEELVAVDTDVGGTTIGVEYDYIDFDFTAVCAQCEDPSNPGFNLPDFTPGFMPTFRYQIGDPTTSLDSFICSLEAGAMVLDWHTRGAVKVWGGELIPYCGKTEYEIAGGTGHPGTSIPNVRQAWLHWDQYLDNRSGQTWDDLVVALQEGRAVVLQGDYGVFTNAEKCQDTFDGNHAISVYPYQVSDRLLVGDPLCHNFNGLKRSSLQAYAEAFGVAVFGATSPQKILFGVSRPWTP